MDNLKKNNGKVIAVEKTLTIPTYKVSQPDKNPLFFEKRVYQGSSGKVYPLPVTEKIFNKKENVEYLAVILENDYLQIMILPSYGGRIQRALDKTNNYDFVYYNQVIKPALVGLTGPWISGGIEFNWPQHHRPSTFMPVDYKITEQEDGSKTVWVSEIDQMYGTKGMAGFTLYPDKAYLEITGKLYNRTDVPQTFLWWANPAVAANEYTLSIFPPDVHAVMDHGKRAVSDFPIATGTYYKQDYSAGVDISKYKNIKVPTSFMAYHSDYNFMGNYDESKQAGLLHVADHHVSPGKKQWVWGNSDFGKAWDRNLTDENGPYIELMTGVFTDNQPDFAWLKPYESKEFKQYFMPYKGVGRVKNATIDGAVNVESINGELYYFLYVSQKQENARVIILKNKEIIYEEDVTLSPASSIKKATGLLESSFSEKFEIKVFNSKNEEIVAYKGLSNEEDPLPNPAEEIPAPEELKSTEELFLAATHLEQYRHATRDPEQYYLEGLKRDNTDIRLNTGYGVFLYKRGLFKESENHLEKAAAKQKWKSPNPYYGEPLFNLGLAQLQLGKRDEAYDTFYKATWNDDTQGQAFFQLACLEMQKKNYSNALEFIDKSLSRNVNNRRARVLKTAILRKLNQSIEQCIKETLAIDPLDLGTYYELGDLQKWKKLMRGSINNYLELSLDYIGYGLYEEALNILENAPSQSPLVHYYQAYIQGLLGNEEEAKAAVCLAEKSLSDYCFPNKLAEIHILQQAIGLLPEETGFARYYLGNLFYDKHRYEEAVTLWEESLKLIPDFPTTYRNLSFAYYNRFDDLNKAMQMIKRASDLDKKDARILLERETLSEKAGLSVESRLALLEERKATTDYRDDLYITYISLLNSTGKYQEAYDLISKRQFHPWEGGEGKVSTQYMFSLIELAKSILEINPKKAIELLLESQTYPNNLGEGKLPNVEDNISNYYIGKAYEKMKNHEKAVEYYRLATRGTNEPGSVLYYNDQPADTIFYRGLAHEALGDKEAARSSYYQLLRYGRLHQFENVDYEFFAVSMPETIMFKNNLIKNNRIYCHYLIALGQIGLGKLEDARKLLEEILEAEPSHQGALRHLEFCN